MAIWITGGANKSIDHGTMQTDPVSVNLFEGWSFDGINDYVTFDDDALVDFPDGDWSVGGWIKPEDSLDDVRYVFDFRDATRRLYLLIRHDLGDWLQTGVVSTGGSYGISPTSVTEITLSVWHHFLLVRDGDDFILYLDGREIGRNAGTSMTAIDPVSPWYIGACYSLASDRFFSGDMCNWGKWDAVLSKADRHALAGGIRVSEIDPTNLKWACAMKRGDYSTGVGGLTITNNGSTDGTTHTATLEAAIDCAGFDVHQGTFDANTYGLDLRGDVLLESNSVVAGSQTWEISGNLDTVDLDAITKETSQFKLTGAGKTVSFPPATHYHNDIWITGTYTLDAGQIRYDGAGVIDGTLAAVSGTALNVQPTATLDINGGVSGDGWLQVFNPGSAKGLIGNDGTLTVANIYFDDPEATSVLDPGDYSNVTDIFYLRERAAPTGDSTLKFQAGTYIFEDIEAQTQNTYDLYIDTTNNPTIEIQGDYTEDYLSTGRVFWTLGAGDTLTFTGSADQGIAFDDCVGNVVVNKSGGTLTLNADLCCASLDIQDGNFNANGYNVTTGDWTLTNAGDTLYMGSGTWECSGNVDWVGCGTVDYGTSVLKLTGTGKTVGMTASSTYCYALWITGSYTIPSGQVFRSNTGDFTVDGTLTCTGDIGCYYVNFILNTGGLVTGTGYLSFAQSNITVLDGTWDTTTGYIQYPLPGNTYVAGTIDCGTLRVSSPSSVDHTIRYGAGTHTFTGDVIYQCTNTVDLTVDMTTNSPTIDFQGDVSVQESSTGQVIFA